MHSNPIMFQGALLANSAVCGYQPSFIVLTGCPDDGDRACTYNRQGRAVSRPLHLHDPHEALPTRQESCIAGDGVHRHL